MGLHHVWVIITGHTFPSFARTLALPVVVKAVEGQLYRQLWSWRDGSGRRCVLGDPNTSEMIGLGWIRVGVARQEVTKMSVW